MIANFCQKTIYEIYKCLVLISSAEENEKLLIRAKREYSIDLVLIYNDFQT